MFLVHELLGGSIMAEMVTIGRADLRRLLQNVHRNPA